MPGGTQRFQLPYMLPTEALHTIANVTKLLAERLDTIISSGELDGAPGQPGPPGKDGADSTVPGPPGPPGDAKPSAVATCAAFGVPAWTETAPPSWSAIEDLNSPGAAQVTAGGLVCRAPGLYLVTLQLPLSGTTAGSSPAGDTFVFSKVKVNGVTRGEIVDRTTGYEHIGMVTVPIRLAAGDLVSAVVVHDVSATYLAGGTTQGGINTRLAFHLLAR